MEEYKIQILRDQAKKLDEVLQVLKTNFDINEECADEYSFLSIVKDKLAEMANCEVVEPCSKAQMEYLSYIGKTIHIVAMKGEPTYNGKIGIVTKVDGEGQLHGTWGGLAVQLVSDTIEIL